MKILHQHQKLGKIVGRLDICMESVYNIYKCICLITFQRKKVTPQWIQQYMHCLI